MSKWIRVEDMYPINGDHVLVWLQKKNSVSHYDVAEFRQDPIDGIVSWRIPYVLNWTKDVTHWMPLPDVPAKLSTG